MTPDDMDPLQKRLFSEVRRETARGETLGLVSAGLSYDMLDRALRNASRIYRVRYLAEKYGLSVNDWGEQAMANDAPESSHDDDTDEELIDVEAPMRATIAEHDHTGPDKTPQTHGTPPDEDSRQAASPIWDAKVS